MNYYFKFKRQNRLFWEKRWVRGHKYDSVQDKMIVFYPDGSIEEIGQWKKCWAFVGHDCIAALEKQRVEDEKEKPEAVQQDSVN